MPLIWTSDFDYAECDGCNAQIAGRIPDQPRFGNVVFCRECLESGIPDEAPDDAQRAYAMAREYEAEVRELVAFYGGAE